MKRIFSLLFTGLGLLMMLLACTRQESIVSLSTDKLVFSNDSSCQYIYLEGTNDSDVVLFNSSESWCDVSGSQYYLIVTVDNNDSAESRSAYITIECNGKEYSVEVLQYAYDPEVGELPESIEIGYDGEEVYVGQVNFEGSVELECGDVWFNARLDDGKLYVSADINYSQESRSSTLTLKSEDKNSQISVVQNANLISLDVTYTVNYDVTPSENGIIFTVSLEGGADDFKFLVINEGNSLYSTDDEEFLLQTLGMAGYDKAYYNEKGLNFLCYKQLNYRVCYYAVDAKGIRGKIGQFYIYAKDLYDKEYGKWIGKWNMAVNTLSGEKINEISILSNVINESYTISGWTQVDFSVTGFGVPAYLDKTSGKLLLKAGKICDVLLDGQNGEMFFYPIKNVLDMSSIVMCDGDVIATIEYSSDVEEMEILPAESDYSGLLLVAKLNGEWQTIVAPNVIWQFPMTLLPYSEQNNITYTRIK